MENRPYESGERQRFLIDQTIDEIDPRGIDLLIIPGGDSRPLFEKTQLKNFIRTILDHGKVVAGICGGSELMAAMGFLDGRSCTGNASGVTEQDSIYPFYQSTKLSTEQVVVDDNVITAQGQAYVEFAVTVAKHIGVLKDEPSRIETLNWFMNRRGEAHCDNTPS